MITSKIEREAAELVAIKGRILELTRKVKTLECPNYINEKMRDEDRLTGYTPEYHPRCRDSNSGMDKSKWCPVCIASSDMFKSRSRERRNYSNCFLRLQNAVRKAGQ